MSNDQSTLFLFPGLGADERLFQHQLDNLDNIVVPEWLPAEKDESLADYCKRFASTLDISPKDFVGGMSFGGQVALEIAKHVECAGCMLISANRRAEEISAQFRLQNKILQTMPESFVKTALKGIAIPKLVNEEKLCDQEKSFLIEMADEMDYNFFRWSSNAAATWDYEFNSADFKTPIMQIHGEHDSIITKSPESEILKGAGHLINYTHATELNEWIKSKMQN